MITARGAFVVYDENEEPLLGIDVNVEALTAVAVTGGLADSGNEIVKGTANGLLLAVDVVNPAPAPEDADPKVEEAAPEDEDAPDANGGKVAATVANGLLFAYAPNPNDGWAVGTAATPTSDAVTIISDVEAATVPSVLPNPFTPVEVTAVNGLIL